MKTIPEKKLEWTYLGSPEQQI